MRANACTAATVAFDTVHMYAVMLSLLKWKKLTIHSVLACIEKVLEAFKKELCRALRVIQLASISKKKETLSFYKLRTKKLSTNITA